MAELVFQTFQRAKLENTKSDTDSKLPEGDDHKPLACLSAYNTTVQVIHLTKCLEALGERPMFCETELRFI